MELTVMGWHGLGRFEDNGNDDFNAEALGFAECAEGGENGLRFASYV